MMTKTLLLMIYSTAMSTTNPDPILKLALLPPSPIREQTYVQIRGSISNPSPERRTYRVTIALENCESSRLLFMDRVEIEPSSLRGTEFNWLPEGCRGKWEIRFSAYWADQVVSITTPIEILDSGQSFPKKIDGAWVVFYHWSEEEGRPWNSQIVNMTKDDWREAIQGMHELGLHIVVIEESFRNQAYWGEHAIEEEGYQGCAYYPSRLFPGRMAIETRDPIEVVLCEADRFNMQVFVPVGLYAFFDFSAGSLHWHFQAAKELFQLYGHHSSFYGWYIPEEIFGNLGGTPQRWEEISTFFREFKAYAASLAPEKPVMLASNCHGVRGAEEAYRELLPNLDILCPFGFNRMPPGDISGEEAYQLLQQLCDESGSHLWMDLELFKFGEANTLVPRTISSVMDDLTRFPYFEKILCYQYTGLMNAPWAKMKPGGEETITLYRNYLDYFRK